WYTIVKINIDNKTVITGLTPGKTYQAIVMEFNGNPGYPSYLTTTSTGNPAAITTLSNVATLSNLNLSAGALTTVFQSETTDYYARVPNEVSSITVTPVASDANAKIKINGIAVASGTPSQVIGNLEVGSLYANSNLITVEVTAQDGTVKIYRIRVFRLLPQPTIQTTGLTFTNTTSTGTTLNWTNGNGGSRTVFMRAGTNADSVPNPNPVSELRNGSYQGNPAFGLGDQIGTTGWYVITHINVDNKIIVTGLTPGTTYQVVIMEYTGSSYYPSYLTTTSTGNPAAVTTLSNVATLSNLNLSAGVLTTLFSSETTAYTAKVSSGAGSIKITPITTDNRATIKVNGVAVTSGNPSQEISLATGASTMITIEVTAQDGTVKNYIITVEKSSLGVVDNKIEGFAVYPNPVPQGKLYLQTKLTALKDVKIFDMSGKMVFSVSTTNREVFIEGLQKGVYILKVNQDGAESTEKLIVE
ncbi:hypothetical protein B0A80_19485, partial [Flavobacterium tructae]|uniref:cadherin-like beta sandwich domain-containing protein n=1 Tax=Flavobacterium tructae TaxID=1114873 RepID=UPI000B6BF912